MANQTISRESPVGEIARRDFMAIAHGLSPGEGCTCHDGKEENRMEMSSHVYYLGCLNGGAILWFKFSFYTAAF